MTQKHPALEPAALAAVYDTAWDAHHTTHPKACIPDLEAVALTAVAQHAYRLGQDNPAPAPEDDAWPFPT